MRSPVLDASTSTAARGRTISDLINQCSRRTPAGTTSQQRSTLPATGRGTICLQGSRRVPGEGQCSPAGGYRTRVCPMAGSLALIREGPLMGRAGSYEVTPSWLKVVPQGRPANRSQASTDAAAEYGARPPPGGWASPGGGAQVGVDLAGDVTLEAA